MTWNVQCVIKAPLISLLDAACFTTTCVEDEIETELNGNRNPEWWGDFGHLQIQIKQK